LFDATERLRRTDEELDAARAINRELMQKANRPDRQTSTAPAGNDNLIRPSKHG
jgi:hypothetical protein